MPVSARVFSLPTIACLILIVAAALAAPPTTEQPQGLREKTPDAHALAGARVVTEPGKVIENGIVVIRDGVITDVLNGDRDKPPADVKVHDVKGKTIYAGFVDAYGEAPAGDPGGAAPYWNDLVAPQRRMAANYSANNSVNEKLRKQGLTVRLAAPDKGVIKGVSALVTTGDDGNETAIVKSDVAQHVRLTVPRGRGRDNYPNSPMGAVALARQAIHDATWYGEANRAKQGTPSLPTIARNDAMAALQSYPGSDKLLIADAINELYFLRADRFAREFGLNLMMRGSGREYRRLDAIKSTGRAVILPLNFPKPPNVATVESAMNVDTASLMHWDLAPENPARLADAGVDFALTTHLLDDSADFLKNLRKAIKRGLSADEALRALTTRPADMYGVSDRIGKVAVGMMANLVVADGDIFADDTKMHAVWVNGKRYGYDKEQPKVDARGRWAFAFNHKGKKIKRELVIEGSTAKLKGHWAAVKKDGEKVELLRVSLEDARMSAVFKGESFGGDGVAQLTAVLTEKASIASGQIVWADGNVAELTAKRTADAKPDDKSSEKEKSDSKKESKAKKGDDAKASFSVNFPLGAFGVKQQVEQPKLVLFPNATVWTSGDAGVLEKASVLVSDGKILAVGENLRTPDGAIVVDATGKHVTPGIIDCHTHMGTDGGVNESTQAITCEVRIGDFVDCNDVTIYRHLAGGITSANILHGSANPIGGQNQVIKLRWGQLSEAMKFTEAPQGVKFALGENVKQSNWGDEYTTRYPQTRMGVEQIMRDAFQAAKEYRARQQAWSQDKTSSLPPRRDLELDAIVEMLEGTRWIHCHSYRQDEILALMRTLESFNIQIGTFQHILEGYKVATEMAKHGAMGSAFSDWWAYKFEVFDAIPYNGALMHEAGVVVSFNSDDRELARHLNHEAAKAVKYGGVSPEEALKFVTLNPAKQLRVDQFVGSIEEGKHADLAVWSGPPLSVFSRCEQTWIDGRKYFDRDADLARRGEDRSQRAVLIQKILASGETMLLPGERDNTEEELWPRDDLFCHGHDHHRHDEDEHDHRGHNHNDEHERR